MPAFASPHRAAFSAGICNVLLRGNPAAMILLIEAEAYVKSIFALLSQKVTKAGVSQNKFIQISIVLYNVPKVQISSP